MAGAGAARLLLGALLAMSGCLLDVEFNKADPGMFCVTPEEVATPPSCNGAQNECGPKRNQFCCESPAVPCGSFIRDYDGEDFDEMDDREATLSDFRLDAYEVTVGRFRAFVEAGQGTQQSPNPSRGAGGHPRYLNSGWDPDAYFDELAVDEEDLRAQLACSDDLRYTWTDAPGDNENKPINCVTWYEALLFCAWDGGRLPSEAEWHYAAAGGDEQRAYPWAEPAGVITPDLAVFGCPDDRPACPTGTSIAPVGSKPSGIGRWGQYDLSGNVAEWVMDTIPDPPEGYVNPCEDCVRIGDGDRGVRGGGFSTEHEDGTVDDLLVASRDAEPPSQRSHAIGFRCLRAIASP
jgi:formylglycine-generating enzyme required for sulfatase activity